MANHRKEHVAEDIKRELVSIIPNLKDPRLKNNLIFVSKINITDKNSSCKIFISAMKDYQIAVKSCKILQSASGHIRSELGKKIRLRYVPLLFFIPSNAVEYGASILEKINKLNINNSINNIGVNNINYEINN